jgi:HK97 family phage prohead protease
MTYKAGDTIEHDIQFTANTAADLPDGYITGIASAPSIDSYGHVVKAGAFDASIKAKGLSRPGGVQLLAFHDWHKPAGVIKKLETIGDNLRIEAQLALEASYVKDLYAVTKMNNGLSFSVGFRLEEFDYDEKADLLVIHQGELIEVSVVCFAACREANMDFVKHQPPGTMAEFEKALVADGLCRSRSEAHRIALAAKHAGHLFQGKQAPSAPAARLQRPMLDVGMLKAATDLAVEAKAIFGSL